MTLYLIPGLGADRRVFSRLTLPAGYRQVHLEWIRPEKGESLHAYSLRMAALIDATEPFGLIGLSMGGMVATEIAQALPARHTVLLSSATSASQLPSYERLLGRMHLERLLPGRLLRQPNPVIYWLLGAEDPESRKLVHDMQLDTDPEHFRWSLGAIPEWKNEQLPQGLIRIHGTEDRIIPIRNIPANHRIAGAGHLAVFTHAGEVSELLRRELEVSHKNG